MYLEWALSRLEGHVLRDELSNDEEDDDIDPATPTTDTFPDTWQGRPASEEENSRTAQSIYHLMLLSRVREEHQLNETVALYVRGIDESFIWRYSIWSIEQFRCLLVFFELITEEPDDDLSPGHCGSWPFP